MIEAIGAIDCMYRVATREFMESGIRPGPRPPREK